MTKLEARLVEAFKQGKEASAIDSKQYKAFVAAFAGHMIATNPVKVSGDLKNPTFNINIF